MDIFSHALWSYGLFGRKGHCWIALFFGFFPDFMSFGSIALFQIINGSYKIGAPALELIPYWGFYLYDFGHSFVITGVIILIIFFIRKDIGFAMLSWIFHIILDAPFHTRYYFPTKIFWPISNYYIDGIGWTNLYIWLPNLAGLAILFFFIFIKKRV